MKVGNNTILILACVLAVAGCTQPRQTAEPVRLQNTITGKTQTSQTSDPVRGKAYSGTISGVISDSMCGNNHAGMGELGKDPVTCTRKCVEQGAKYVLVDETGNIFSLSNQGKVSSFAGKTVSVTGHIDPATKAIHVHSLEDR